MVAVVWSVLGASTGPVAAAGAAEIPESWSVPFVDDHVWAIEPDGVDGVYVAGQFGSDAFLARYDSAGEQLWLERLGAAAQANAVAVSPTSNRVYVATSRNQIFTFDRDGTLVSSAVGHGGESVSTLAAAPDGSLYAAGSGPDNAAYVRRFNADGEEDWTEEVSLHQDADQQTVTLGIAALSDGRLSTVFTVRTTDRYQTLRYVGIVFESDGGLRALNPALLSDDDGPSATIRGLTATDDGGFIIFGAVDPYLSHNETEEGVILRWNSDYQLDWVREVGSRATSDSVSSVAVDDQGRVHVLTSRSRLPSRYPDPVDIVLSVFSPNGSMRWEGRVPGPTYAREGLLALSGGGMDMDVFAATSYDDVLVTETSTSSMLAGSDLRSLELTSIRAATQECDRTLPHPFSDVGAPATRVATDVSCIFTLDVTTGTSATTYSPDDVVTRAQMAAFLARTLEAITGMECPTVTDSIFGTPRSATVTMPFNDILESSFAYEPIGCIYFYRITTGTSADTYGPNEMVTRAQMAAFVARLYRMLTGDLCTDRPMPFDDVADTLFARNDIACISALGITTGTTPTTYDPDDAVTRGQMASFLSRLYRLLI